MKIKKLLKYIPFRMVAFFAVSVLIMVFWIPLIVAILEASSSAWVRFKYEIRTESFRWFDALQTSWRALLSGKPQ